MGASHPPRELGELLLKHGMITLSQLEDLIKEQESSGMPFGELVLSKGIMSRQDLLTALDWQHKSDQVIIDSLTELNQQAQENLASKVTWQHFTLSWFSSWFSSWFRRHSSAGFRRSSFLLELVWTISSHYAFLPSPKLSTPALQELKPIDSSF